jgi:hypothetical protein
MGKEIKMRKIAIIYSRLNEAKSEASYLEKGSHGMPYYAKKKDSLELVEWPEPKDYFQVFGRLAKEKTHVLVECCQDKQGTQDNCHDVIEFFKKYFDFDSAIGFGSCRDCGPGDYAKYLFFRER